LTLILHAGAQAIDYDGLRSLETPPATATHHPLPHHELVNMVTYALNYWGHAVTKQEFGVMPDGSRFYGVLTLKSEYDDYTDLVGLANSHNKTTPIQIGFGSSTFVCDNTAFRSDIVVRRKHTQGSKRQLPGLIAEIIEPLKQQRVTQHMMFERYKGTTLDDGQADGLIMQMFRRQIINCTRIPEVLEQWENPSCDWGPKTAYRLFNGATWSLKPKVTERPALTQHLHELIDGVCVPA
jgi:uncharacterized protein DUF932